jgi:hypothetical protein
MSTYAQAGRKCLALLAVAATLGGCAVGGTQNYADAPPGLQAVASSGTVAVGVQDARPYVASGAKPEKFVGLRRGGYGNPFDVSTQSGGALALEMRDSIAASLKARGISAYPVAIAVSDAPADARRKLGESRARRLVLVTLREWKSDTMMNTDLNYDVTLAVFDESGRQLATSSVKGMDSLGSSPSMSAVSSRKIDQLFADDKVVAALK